MDEEDEDDETERPYQQLYRHSWEDHSEEETMELLDLPRSMSPQPADGKDCIALDLGSSDSSDSSSSSSSSTSSNDVDDAFVLEDELQSVEHNRDWEVQMLARELERREGISRLENEVRDLKAAVSSSDLSRLTKSELDILEQVLVAEDRKVRAAARAFSLDSDENVTEEKNLRGPPTRHKEELRPTSLSSSALHKRKLLKQKSTNGGGSIENLLHKTALLKNRLLSATAKRHQLLNARSLDESPETSGSSAQAVSSLASGATVPARNRSASSGSITPVGRSSSFPFSIVKGLGNLVRNSSGSSSAQHSRQSSISPDGSALPTISRTCGTVSPNSSHHSDDPSGSNL